MKLRSFKRFRCSEAYRG